MKKILIAAGLIAATTFVNAQAITKGTVHVGVGWNAIIGGAGVETKYDGVSNNQGSVSVRFNYGVRAQYSFIDKLSAGIYLRKEVAAYANADEYPVWDNLTTNALGVGAEIKFYFFNRERFVMYAAPSLGIVKSTDRFEGIYYDDIYYNNISYNENGKSSGISYGVTYGLGWYWGKYVGMSFDVGLNGLSHKGKLDDVSPKYEYHVKGLGVTVGIGIIGKFGGN